MSIAIAFNLILAQQHSGTRVLANIGKCSVIRKLSGFKYEPDLAVIRRGSLTIAKCKVATGDIVIHKNSHYKRFLVSVAGSALLVVSYDGKLVASINYPVYRDPRPLLINWPFALYGGNNYNWNDLDGELLSYLGRERWFRCINLVNGKEFMQTNLKMGGFPLLIRGRVLYSVNLTSWAFSDKLGIPKFECMKTDLDTGFVKFYNVNVAATDARRLLRIIVGWGDLSVQVGSRPNEVTLRGADRVPVVIAIGLQMMRCSQF